MNIYLKTKLRKRKTHVKYPAYQNDYIKKKLRSKKRKWHLKQRCGVICDSYGLVGIVNIYLFEKL